MSLATKEFESVSQLFSYFNDAYENRNVQPLHIFIFLPKKGITPESMVELARENGLNAEIKKRGDKIYSISIGVRTSDEPGYLIVDDDYWIFFSDQFSLRIVGVVESFVRNMFPILRLAYLTSDKVVELVNKLSKNYDETQLLDGTLVGEKRTLRSWERKGQRVQFSVKLVKEEERKQQAKWSSVAVACFYEKMEKLKIRIYGKGYFTLYYGSFSNLYKNIVLDFIATSLNIDKFFSNRERKIVDEEVKLNPLLLKVKDTLSQPQIDIIKTTLLKEFTASVMYSGNPMLLMQLTDKKDGSSFDFYAYRDEIKIVPLLRASSGSLTHLFEVVTETLPTTTLQDMKF